MAYEVVCVGAEETVVVFPAYRRLNFAFRVLVEQDVKRDPGFHERGLDPFGTIVYSKERGENLGKVKCQETQKTQQKISRHAWKRTREKGGRFKGYATYNVVWS